MSKEDTASSEPTPEDLVQREQTQQILKECLAKSKPSFLQRRILTLLFMLTPEPLDSETQRMANDIEGLTLIKGFPTQTQVAAVMGINEHKLSREKRLAVRIMRDALANKILNPKAPPIDREDILKYL